MKKIYYVMLAAIAATTFSCKDKTDEPTPGPGTNDNPDAVEVTIATTEIETKAAVTEFKASDEMNIFAKTYARIDAPNIIDNVKATYDGSKWTMSPAVKIDQQQKNAFLFAVSPYDASYTDAQKIPVDIAKQVDLMYSGSYVPASLTSPAVKLTMKHALSLLSFNIIPVNFSGAGSLKSIKLEGDIFYTTGTMDVSNGKITKGSTGAVTVNTNANVADGGWKNNIPGVWAIPFNTKAGTVNITFNIDGKEYNLTVPEVEMKQGFQYIFRLVLTNNGLEFDPSKTETISLNVTTDTAQSFEGYGLISLQTGGSALTLPSLFGDNVFGTINTSTKSMPYEPSISLNSVSAGQTIIIESWNSTGVNFDSLEGIDTIDLSQYE